MKFIGTHKKLLKGLASVSPLAGRNPQLPILQHVLLEVRDGVLHMTGTDLEVGAHVVVAGKAEKDGSCAVTARQLLEYVQQLPDSSPIELELRKKRLVVSTDGFRAEFPTVGAEDFPLLPVPEDVKPINFDGRLFCQALSRTLFAAARDETRPELYSIYIKGSGEGLRLAATDSFRLAEQVLSYDGGEDFSILLPVSTAQEVVRLFGAGDEMSLLHHKSYVALKGDGVDLSSRLVDGSYPEYQQIIPVSFVAEGVVNKGELLRALKVLNVFIPRDTRRVRVEVQPKEGRVVLSVEGGDTGQGRVEVEYDGEGEEMEALFNINYLLEGVSQIVGDKCDVKFGGASDPVLVAPHDSDSKYLYIVMPIQA